MKTKYEVQYSMTEPVDDAEMDGLDNVIITKNSTSKNEAGPGKLNRQVSELYREVGKVMAKYTSGTLPKAFKILPSLTNWEEIITLTSPERWSAASMYEATVLFSSNLKSDMAQKFYHNILLPRLRSDIDEYKKLNFHLYNALKRSLYKPAAFFKGLILPLCEDPDCSLREALIISSVVKRKHVPLLHSAAAMLKIAEMPYTTAREMFLIDLISKNYALPYRVVDAIVDHFIRYTHDDQIELNVQWHKTLLKFCQSYAKYLAVEQRDAIIELVKRHPHHLISAEVISSLNVESSR